MADIITRTPRPIAPAPIAANIPAELKARCQWVVWRYELRNDIWTKVPYTPATTRKASHSRPSTWRSFAAAVACHQERSDFFAGIGYVFSADDPYVGVDFDDCLSDAGQPSDFAQQHLPATYAEISPSGTGIKFIGRASGTYGRKTPIAEVYNQKRFFTFTGNVLPGHTAIIDVQSKVDALITALGAGSATPAKDGTAGSGSRAELVKTIPESEWEAARKLAVTQGDSLLRRLRASRGEGTQLGVLLASDYAGFHRRWPFVGLYRADGTLDDSQVRAVAANGIRSRGFTFAEYVVLMSRLYAARALAKWGTKQAWREELVALWHKSPEPKRLYTPRASGLVPAKKPKIEDVIEIPRGPGRPSHAPEVERFYLFLRETIASESPVRIGDLADGYGVHRRTVATYLDELRTAHSIRTRRLGRGKGLIISFDDVIEIPASDSALLPAATREIDAPAAPLEETLSTSSCVSSMSAPQFDHISDEAPTAQAPAYEPPAVFTLADVLTDLLDNLPRQRPNLKTGELSRWPVTDHRVLEALAERYPAAWRYWRRYAPLQLRWVRKKRKNAQFEEIRKLDTRTLDRKIASLAHRIRRCEQRRDEASDPTIATYWQSEANQRQGFLKLHAEERAKRADREEARIVTHGYSLVEQAEMLELVDRVRESRARKPARAVPTHKTTPNDESASSGEARRQQLYANLRARQADTVPTTQEALL